MSEINENGTAADRQSIAQVDLDESTARALVATVRTSIDQVREAILRLWSGRAWIVLGYPDWDAMCDTEFQVRLALPATDRREVVRALSDEGMSARAIAKPLGSSEATVCRDLAAASNDAAGSTVGSKHWEEAELA